MISKKDTILIFDLWQTLADSKIRPSSLYTISALSSLATRADFLPALFSSVIFTQDIPFSESWEQFIGQYPQIGQSTEEVFALWQQMAEQAYLIPGAKQIIEALRAHGYQLCLLTNVDKYGYEHFIDQDFLKNFSYVFASYKEGLLKPDFCCWEKIKMQYNAPYGQICMIGDSMTNDIAPAGALGMQTILIDQSQKDPYAVLRSTFLT